MNGMDLSRDYFKTEGLPMLERDFPHLLPRLAIGLVGEGSHCFGFDDEFSRDHDWGPGFCIWMSDDDFIQHSEQLQSAYEGLPGRFKGWQTPAPGSDGARRLGVHRISDFFRNFLGLDHPPRTIGEWFSLPQENIAICVNGEVFWDQKGEFSAFRKALSDFYPEDIRLKKLSAACAVAAQAGQYNYGRCLGRGESAAALRALSAFTEQASASLFLLHRRYMPFYKWSNRALSTLSALGEDVSNILNKMAESDLASAGKHIEAVCSLIAAALREHNLTTTSDNFLLAHAVEIQSKIQHPGLKKLHIMSARCDMPRG